jgi:hypothetical protein
LKALYRKTKLYQNKKIESTNQSNTPTIQPTTKQSKSILFLTVLILTIIPLSVCVGIQIGKNSANNKQQIIVSPTIVPTQKIIDSLPSTTIPKPSINQSDNWKTAKYGGIFSYEYPTNWHVAELWDTYPSTNDSHTTTIVIDPNPISTAPRGGPPGSFLISVISGSNNPDKILTEQINTFNEENYSDITKETLTTDIGTIYHYYGKIKGEMMQGALVEKYYFTFNQNPKDLINQQVIIASLELANNPEYSTMLKHIVLSFKKLTP